MIEDNPWYLKNPQKVIKTMNFLWKIMKIDHKKS